MSDVAALVEAQAQGRVARLHQSQVGSGVCVGARVGLHVGERGAEELLHSVTGQVFDLVDDFVAAVIALARVSLGVFVGENCAHGLDDRRRDEVFRGNQLEGAVFTLDFLVDEAEKLWIVKGLNGHRTELLKSVGDALILGQRRRD